jgi:hypothetical protein
MEEGYVEGMVELLGYIEVNPQDVKKFYSDWNPIYQEILNLATNNFER